MWCAPRPTRRWSACSVAALTRRATRRFCTAPDSASARGWACRRSGAHPSLLVSFLCIYLPCPCLRWLCLSIARVPAVTRSNAIHALVRRGLLTRARDHTLSARQAALAVSNDPSIAPRPPPPIHHHPPTQPPSLQLPVRCLVHAADRAARRSAGDWRPPARGWPRICTHPTLVSSHCPYVILLPFSLIIKIEISSVLVG